jgi:hypothetical protein
MQSKHKFRSIFALSVQNCSLYNLNFIFIAEFESKLKREKRDVMDCFAAVAFCYQLLMLCEIYLFSLNMQFIFPSENLHICIKLYFFFLLAALTPSYIKMIVHHPGEMQSKALYSQLFRGLFAERV